MNRVNIDPVGDHLRQAAVVEMTPEERERVVERCGEELDELKRLKYVSHLDEDFVQTAEAPYKSLTGEEGFVKVVAYWGSEDDSDDRDEAYVYVRASNQPEGSEVEVMGLTRRGLAVPEPGSDPVEPSTSRESHVLLNRIAEVRRKVAAKR